MILVSRVVEAYTDVSEKYAFSIILAAFKWNWAVSWTYIFLIWRQRKCVLPKRLYSRTRLHDVTTEITSVHHLRTHGHVFSKKTGFMLETAVSTFSVVPLSPASRVRAALRPCSPFLNEITESADQIYRAARPESGQSAPRGTFTWSLAPYWFIENVFEILGEMRCRFGEENPSLIALYSSQYSY